MSSAFSTDVFRHKKRKTMEEAPWIPMDFHGCPWISLDFHGFPWISMDFYGFPWVSMDFHRCPRISMDFHGFDTPGGTKLCRNSSAEIDVYGCDFRVAGPGRAGPGRALILFGHNQSKRLLLRQAPREANIVEKKEEKKKQSRFSTIFVIFDDFHDFRDF